MSPLQEDLFNSIKLFEEENRAKPTYCKIRADERRISSLPELIKEVTDEFNDYSPQIIGDLKMPDGKIIIGIIKNGKEIEMWVN